LPAAAGAFSLSTWARTSAFSTRPLAVLIFEMSTPCCSAIVRARGDALTAVGGAVEDETALAAAAAGVDATAVATAPTSPGAAMTAIV
jgi:hypothetical protein